VSIAGIRSAIRGRVGVHGQPGWMPPADPFELQLRAFLSDIQRNAGVTPTATTARDVASLFAACAAKRRPLEGPASPAVELDVVGVR